MQQATPPTGTGPLAKSEARLAWGLLSPTLISVAVMVILPVFAVFWISVKPVQLADLRAPQAKAYERIRGKLETGGDEAILEYKLSNSSREKPVNNVILEDELPVGLSILSLDPRCTLDKQTLHCELGDFKAAYKEKLRLPVRAEQRFIDAGGNARVTTAVVTGEASSALWGDELTLENFSRGFDGEEFFEVLKVTLIYTVVGTIGALLVGMFAALLLNRTFPGRGALRGLLLFPYVAPVIAVAFSWVTLFDPYSGSINALLIQMGATDTPINFFGEKPLALISVIVFEIWRYFPLSFLFILARMQSIDTDMYEAADMDGASPLQKFWYLSVPQLLGILSVLFLLRFIWTFNKFDDIFLLTGGNAGTRTLTVSVYEQAFALSNIGAGAAVAVVIFSCLIVFSMFFFKYVSQEEGL